MRVESILRFSLLLSKAYARAHILVRHGTQEMPLAETRLIFDKSQCCLYTYAQVTTMHRDAPLNAWMNWMEYSSQIGILTKFARHDKVNAMVRWLTAANKENNLVNVNKFKYLQRACIFSSYSSFLFQLGHKYTSFLQVEHKL